jgi:outer membrane protein assembly factor BamE (lipoprotein component of BamABCDE complex)
MRILGIVALCAALGGCAFQRAEIAQDARAQMVGMTKEQVLACMGAPATKAAEGATEVWGFASGNGTTVASANYDRYGGTAVSSSRFCNVNIVFAGGQVSTINYTGPTGGLLTASEQCAYAVNNCVRRQ